MLTLIRMMTTLLTQLKRGMLVRMLEMDADGEKNSIDHRNLFLLIDIDPWVELVHRFQLQRLDVYHQTTASRSCDWTRSSEFITKFIDHFSASLAQNMCSGTKLKSNHTVFTLTPQKHIYLNTFWPLNNTSVGVNKRLFDKSKVRLLAWKVDK